MAISPADFYAYSRATGVPVPEDPAERMQMAPEVMEFRRNQLRAPQQQSEGGADPLSVGLGVGLALAGGVGAALGARRLFRGPKQSATAGVRQANLAEMAAETSPVREVAKSSAPAPSQTPPTAPQRQEVYKAVAQKPVEELPRVYRPKGSVETDELITDPNTGEVFRRGKSPASFTETYISLRPELAGQKIDLPVNRTPGSFKEFSQDVAAKQEFSPRSYIEQTGAVAPAEDLTSLQQRNVVQVADQNINAVESGEDQMTGRVRQQLQRNEDLNLSSIDVLEDQTNSMDAVAATLSDGIPADQAESLATKPTYTFREKIYLEPSQRIQEQRARVQTRQIGTPVFAIGRYPALSETVAPTRAVFPGELGSSVGESIVATQVDPYVGRTNVKRDGVEFTVVGGKLQNIPVRYTVESRGTRAEGLLGPERPVERVFSPEEAQAKIEEFQTSKNAQIQSAMARGLSEARARRNVLISESQKQAIESTLPAYSDEDVMSRPGMKSYGDVAEAERYAEEISSRAGKIKALEEGGFLEEQVDPGQLRTEPRQVRPGVLIQPASRTSPRGMTSRPGMGIYGEQGPGARGSLDFGQGAVEVQKIIKNEGEERGVTTPRAFTSGLDDPQTLTPEGFVYTEEALTQPTKAKGGYKGYATQAPTRPEAASDSLRISQELTRLQREGKQEEAQAFLDKIMEERGVSAMGISQPLRQTISRRGRFTV